MQFGRTPGDLAFAAGNRELFAMLYSAAMKTKPAAPEPKPDQANIPPPEDFWKYLQNAPTKQQQPAAPAAQALPSAPPASQSQPTKEEHPRKQFEAWLGGVLFPQRQKSGPSVATGGGSPYGRVDKVEGPAPSLAAPSFSALTGGYKGQGAGGQAHTVGHAGGSAFANKRAEQKQQAASGVEENLTMGLEPYGAPSAAPSAPAAPADSKPSQQPAAPANPLMQMMQAMGRKAQADIKTTLGAAGALAEDMKKQQALANKPGAQQCMLCVVRSNACYVSTSACS
jgi:hypothetical protein